jgi:hypothetical protein
MPGLEREHQKRAAAESHSTLFADAYNFCANTIANPRGRLRQADVTTAGAALGGLKQVPKELVNHPWETVGKVATAAVAGAAFSAAAASESPVIAGGALVIGAIGMGGAALDTCISLGKNERFRRAMDAVYKSDDPATELKALQEVSDVAGPEGFDYGIAILGSVGAIDGPKAWHDIQINRLTLKLVPPLPMPRVVPTGAVEMAFRNDCILHMHGDQAIIRLGGAEHNLHVFSLSLTQNSRKIDLKAFENVLGRQVLKGRYAGSLNPFEIEINPEKGITEVRNDQIREYKHSALAAWKPFIHHQETICQACTAQRNSQ